MELLLNAIDMMLFQKCKNIFGIFVQKSRNSYHANGSIAPPNALLRIKFQQECQQISVQVRWIWILLQLTVILLLRDIIMLWRLNCLLIMHVVLLIPKVWLPIWKPWLKPIMIMIAMESMQLIFKEYRTHFLKKEKQVPS